MRLSLCSSTSVHLFLTVISRSENKALERGGAAGRGERDGSFFLSVASATHDSRQTKASVSRACLSLSPGQWKGDMSRAQPLLGLGRVTALVYLPHSLSMTEPCKNKLPLCNPRKAASPSVRGARDAENPPPTSFSLGKWAVPQAISWQRSKWGVKAFPRRMPGSWCMHWPWHWAGAPRGVLAIAGAGVSHGGSDLLLLEQPARQFSLGGGQGSQGAEGAARQGFPQPSFCGSHFFHHRPSGGDIMLQSRFYSASVQNKTGIFAMKY